MAVLTAGLGAGLAAGFGAGFGAGLVTGFAAGFGAGLVTGLAADFSAGFGAGLAAGFAAGFGAGLAAGFGAGLATGFVAGFGAGLAGADALKRREKIPFFSATVDHHLHEIGNATRVAPLVVIPGDHLCKGPVHHHGAPSVDDCRARVTAEIGRDEWFV